MVPPTEIFCRLLFAASSAWAFLVLPSGRSGARWLGLALAGAWFLSAFLLAIPYCRRFGGRGGDTIRVGGSLGALFVLPLVPRLIAGELRPDGTLILTAAAMFYLLLVVAKSFRAQGRYAYTERDLPELAGDARAAAESVLERAGLRPTSIRVGPLGSFNAGVQGMRTCAVLVDRRTSESLMGSEFAALIAHEACHIGHGGIFPYIAVWPVVLCGVNAMTSFKLGGVVEGGALLLLGLFLKTLVSQWLEARCDRFAARLTSPDDVRSMLGKVYADMPVGLARLYRRTLLAPFFSHPPLEVRLALLDGGRGAAVSRFEWAWVIALIALFSVPLGVSIAARAARVEMPQAAAMLLAVLPVLYGLFWLVLQLAVMLIVLRASRASGIIARRGRWVRRLIILQVAVGLSFLACALVGRDRWLAAWALGFFALALLFTVLGLLLGAFRFGPPILRLRVRRALVEVQAALEEGLPDEGLGRADDALTQWPENTWLLVSRAGCLLRLGRFDEAVASLEKPLQSKETRAVASLTLCAVEFLRGNTARAEDLIRPLADDAPADPSVWQWKGTVEHAAGKHDDAERSFRRACELKEKNAPALAGRVLVALERGPPSEDVATWLQNARSQEPKSEPVLLASARWHQANGDLENARADLEAAVEQLRSHGALCWIPRYEKLGRKWGILEGGEPCQ